MRKLIVASVLGAVSLAGTGAVEAASGTLISFAHPDPIAGTGCKRFVTFHYDTTKVPPAWSSGYVVCS